VVKLGNNLNKNILEAVQLKSGPLFQKLADALGMTVEDLAKYEVLREVPLNTIGGFMKADIMLVKRDEFKNVTDAIIIENKLSSGTAFTLRQKEGFGAVISGHNSMEITYDIKLNEVNIEPYFTKGDKIPTNSNKIVKISDAGTDNILNVNINTIKSIK